MSYVKDNPRDFSLSILFSYIGFRCGTTPTGADIIILGIAFINEVKKSFTPFNNALPKQFKLLFVCKNICKHTFNSKGLKLKYSLNILSSDSFILKIQVLF